MLGSGRQGYSFPVFQIIVLVEAPSQGCHGETVNVNGSWPSGYWDWASGGERQGFQRVAGRRVGTEASRRGRRTIRGGGGRQVPQGGQGDRGGVSVPAEQTFQMVSWSVGRRTR